MEKEKNVLVQIKTLGLNITSGAMNLICDAQCIVDDKFPRLEMPVCHIRWWLEDILGRVFNVFYKGSREEYVDALYMEFGTDLERYTTRQKEIIARRYGIT